MKKKTIISCFTIVASFLLFTIPVKIYALNYTITFTGTGASTSVQSVVVQNLTKGTTVTVLTGNVLNLSDVATSIEKVTEMTNGISIYPNPIQEKSTVTFFAKQDGRSQISIFGLDGRKIIGTTNVFLQGKNSFQVSVPTGVYSLQVQGNGFSYNTKLISLLDSETKSQITFTSNDNQLAIKPQKSKSALTTMLYSSGDQLLYKGISGNYSTIVTDKPAGSKTTNFDFVECKDGDGNYYPVVKIGSQLWMAENLKTTKYSDGSPIPNLVSSSDWANPSGGAYCDNPNGLAYGKLYNWYTTIDSKNLAPVGWHVPTQVDWYTLSGSLGNQNVAGGKLKETGVDHWSTPNSSATNESGFTALPGSYRNQSGNVMLDGNYGYWWSSTQYNYPPPWDYAWTSRLCSSETLLYIYYDFNKITGLAVRCVKD